MEEKLKIVLKKYIKDVENICYILLKSINFSENLNFIKNMIFLRIDQFAEKWSSKQKELVLDYMAGDVWHLMKNCL